MDKLTVYPFGTEEPGVTFECANGFVSRCVSNIADNNIPDAEWACKVLNTFGHLVKHSAEELYSESESKPRPSRVGIGCIAARYATFEGVNEKLAIRGAPPISRETFEALLLDAVSL